MQLFVIDLQVDYRPLFDHFTATMVPIRYPLSREGRLLRKAGLRIRHPLCGNRKITIFLVGVFLTLYPK